MMATNLSLTALTAGRLLWIRRTTSCVDVKNRFRARCNRAIGLILESGAIYCIVMIFLLITVSLNAQEMYGIEAGFASQLINIIPTFTLVYVGLDDRVNESRLDKDLNTPPPGETASSSAVHSWQSSRVLDIHPWVTNNQSDEYV
ncbi:hypothetical protein B0H12DRAFT_1122947 [Mycena haematopus]|nr:hypothetical protein B0H12DRAFT_1122947 [Mycena haematopus]